MQVGEWMTATGVRTCSATEAEISICYQTFGDKSTGKPLLLVMGLGGSATSWDEKFIEKLVLDHDFFVIRMDNRDIGLSSNLRQFKPPHLFRLALPRFLWPKVAYHLKDMADDCVALLDHLKLDKVHVLGVSMGGMITQELLIHHSRRLLSATLMNTTSGNHSLPDPALKVTAEFLKKPKSQEKEDLLDFAANMQKHIVYSHLHDAPWDWIRERSRVGIERAPRNPSGFIRQMWAIRGSKPRDAALLKIENLAVPTTVLVGLKDILVPPVHGYHLAGLISNSKLVTVPDMPHFVLPTQYKLLAEIVSSTAQRAVRSRM